MARARCVDGVVLVLWQSIACRLDPATECCLDVVAGVLPFQPYLKAVPNELWAGSRVVWVAACLLLQWLCVGGGGDVDLCRCTTCWWGLGRTDTLTWHRA